MDVIEALHSRISNPKLTDPIPDTEALATMFRAASRASDHAQLRPWQFVVVNPDRRRELGLLWAEAVAKSNLDANEALLDKTKNLPMRAPMIVIAICKYREHPKVPKIEQVIATGAAVQNFILAAHALGFAAYWRTGELARNPNLKAQMQLGADDEIVGFVYLGSAAGSYKKISPQEQSDFVSFF